MGAADSVFGDSSRCDPVPYGPSPLTSLGAYGLVKSLSLQTVENATGERQSLDMTAAVERRWSQPRIPIEPRSSSQPGCAASFPTLS